jgi:transposase
MKKGHQKQGIVKFNSGLPVFNHHAAGIDIGDTLHCVAIGDGTIGHLVKTTSGFTCDLKEIVDFLVEHKITTAAMESTGVYWLPLFLMLEEAGIEPYLVNAKHVKNVTGRKKDDTDAIWIQKLHACGLLQKSFQPEIETRILRDYTRQRRNLITLNSDTVRRMQKALELMNIKVHTVISDILGTTGQRIIKAILSGERDPATLASLSDARIKATPEQIQKSLQGIWKQEYLFMLEQAFEHYEFHQKQIRSCEHKIEEQLLKQVAIVQNGDITELENGLKKKSKVKPRKNGYSFKIGPYLKEMVGVDICKIQGISESALEFIAEVGTDMSKWKNYKHFAAWLNLAPNSKISGGKVITSKRMKKKNKAGQILKQAASTLSTSKSALGDYYRKMRARLGGRGAVTATAHKLSKIIYTMILQKEEYKPEILVGNQQKYNQDKIRKLEKQIAKLKEAA